MVLASSGRLVGVIGQELPLPSSRAAPAPSAFALAQMARGSVTVCSSPLYPYSVTEVPPSGLALAPADGCARARH